MWKGRVILDVMFRTGGYELLRGGSVRGLVGIYCILVESSCCKVIARVLSVIPLVKENSVLERA